MCVCVCVYIYIYIYIYVKCEEVYRALCDLEWYKLEPRKAKSLILLMIRTNQPFRITAGKVFPLTMTTFCSVRLLIIYLKFIVYKLFLLLI